MLEADARAGELRMIGATTLDEYRERIERIRPLSGASSRSSSMSRVSRTRSRSCAACASGTNTRWRSLMLPWSRLPRCRTATSRLGSCRQGDRPGRRGGFAIADGDRLRRREIDELRRTVERMMQKFALEKESDPGGIERLNRLTEDLANAQGTCDPLSCAGSGEGLGQVELKKQIDELRVASERAYEKATWSKPARSTTARFLPWKRNGGGRQYRGSAAFDGLEEVGPNDVAEVVSNWTGIPVGRLLQGETEKLMSMESRVGERLVGQLKAVRAVRMRYAAPAPRHFVDRSPPAPSCSLDRPASARPAGQGLAEFCSMTSGP